MRQPANRVTASLPPRSRSTAERSARPLAGRRAAAHPGGQRLTQLAALANPGPDVIQRVIDTAPPALEQGNRQGTMPVDGVTSLLPRARAIVGRVRGESTAATDPQGMGEWKGTGLLGDPSKNGRQTLTRMHAIRGKFGGPAAAGNMFLGTASSNNFNPASHFKLVEQPLEKYLRGRERTGETRAFDYKVDPNYTRVPAYMSARIAGITDQGRRGAFRQFATTAIPDGFECHARLYRQVDNTVYASVWRRQHVATDVGAPQAAPVVPPAPVRASGPSTTRATVLGGVLGYGLATLASLSALPTIATVIGGGLLAHFFTRHRA